VSREVLRRYAITVAEVNCLINLLEVITSLLTEKISKVSGFAAWSVRDLHNAVIKTRNELLGNLLPAERLIGTVLGQKELARIESEAWATILERLSGVDGVRYNPVLSRAVAVADAVYDIVTCGRPSEGVDIDWFTVLHKLMTDPQFFKAVVNLARGKE